MRDKDTITSFANMVKWKINRHEESRLKFPFTPTELIQGTEKGPISDLYNVIFMTLHDVMKVNEYGYAMTKSKVLATKIWYLANDWEALVLRGSDYRNPKQVMFGMNIYRLTCSKQVMIHLKI